MFIRIHVSSGVVADIQEGNWLRSLLRDPLPEHFDENKDDLSIWEFIWPEFIRVAQYSEGEWK